ncbi:hypothetical protein KAR91_14915 [Candidatus Pacearchaeota archaeon]|nr:hypothetical protein [Candidatus Pacearchaeota archaeon]
MKNDNYLEKSKAARKATLDACQDICTECCEQNENLMCNEIGHVLSCVKTEKLANKVFADRLK